MSLYVGRLSLIVILLSFTSGCLMWTHKADKNYKGPLPLPKELDIRYEVAWPPLSEIERVHSQNSRITHIELNFVVEYEKGTRPVRMEYFRPSSHRGRLAAAIVMPIRGGTYTLSRAFAKWLTMGGMASVIVHRPEPWFTGEKTLEDMENLFQIGVKDQRLAMKWLKNRDEIDPGAIGVLGTSLGALAATIVSGLEPEIGATILLMGGGNAAGMIMDTSEGPIKAYRKARIRKTGLSARAWKKRAEKILKTDPLLLAPYVDARKTIQFISIFDRAIPPKYQWALRRALGKPTTVSVTAGHYSAVLSLPVIMPWILKYFREKLRADIVTDVEKPPGDEPTEFLLTL